MSLHGIDLGPALVYKDQFQFEQDVIISKAEQLAKDTPGFDTLLGDTLEIGNAGSTAAGQWAPVQYQQQHQLGKRQPHLWPELKGFTDWAFPKIAVILKHFEIAYDEIYISNSWLNRHRKGGFTNWHIHNNIDITMAAYISAPPDSGGLIMADPLETVWASNPSVQRRIYAKGGYVLPAETNSVYFFPGWLRHRTEASQSDQDRWVLTMNFNTYIKQRKQK
mgnify:CR=1 FL=1